ncbi:hypothetical protein BY458DRAFT_470557 [Sporodiniella umbellata]|nr:hypothetical protein BY458DRAFT_470557 [Sporodiniella umbellata]
MASLTMVPRLVRPSSGLLANSLRKQPLLASHVVFSQTTLLGLRSYGSKHEPVQIPLRDLGVFANYIPPETSPSIKDFTNWRLTQWRNLKNSVQNLMSVGILKRKSQFDKWNSQKFLAEAGETYKDMNDAFARGDRDILEEVCLDAMYSNLKNQMKSRNNVRWEWKYHGDVESPRIVCLRCISTTGLSKHGFAIAQVTVRMFTKQSMAVFDKRNRVVGGDPNKIHNVLEHVVFQKTVSDPEDIWRVFGKIAPLEKLKNQ